MSRREEDELIARIDADTADPDAWEDDPAPARTGGRRTLGAQITIRLEPKFAKRLRAIAEARGVGYTTLARELLEDQLTEDDESPWTPTQRKSLERLIDTRITGRMDLERAFRIGASEGDRP